VALSVTGDATGSEIAKYFGNTSVAGYTGNQLGNNLGVEITKYGAVVVAPTGSTSAYPGASLVVYVDSPSGKVMTAYGTGSNTVPAFIITTDGGTICQSQASSDVSLTVMGAPGTGHVQEWYTNGSTLVAYLDQYGNAAIEPLDTGAAACLTVLGTVAGNNYIAEFATSGSYDVLLIAPPNNTGNNPAAVLTGDGTNDTLKVYDNTLSGNPVLQIPGANGNHYAPVIIGQGTRATADYQLSVVANLVADTGTGSWFNTDNQITVTPTATSNNVWIGTNTNVNLNGTVDYNGSALVGTWSTITAGTSGDISGGSITAVFGGAYAAGTGTINEVVGVAGQASADNGTVGTLIGVQVEAASNPGITVTESYGLFVVDSTALLGITDHNYGLYVSDQSAVAGGATLSDPWAIYVEGGVSGFKGVATNIATITTTYTVGQNDHTLNCNGTFTVTLPTTGLKVGQEFYIKNIGTGTITVSSTANIDGSTTYSMGAQYQSVVVQWDGTQYWIY
jgi:hypothetical protein